MKKNQNISTGVTFGIVIGLIYAILLFFRWQSATNFIQFGIQTLFDYIVIIILLFTEAVYRKKQNGGFIEIKELMQTLFVSVLIFEFFYSAFNFVYLKYIDPDVINEMKAAMGQMLDKMGDQVTAEQRKDSMARFDKLDEATDIWKNLQSYVLSVAVSGIVALIISAIMRKKKPVFQDIT